MFYSEANVSFDVPRVETIGTSAGEPQKRILDPNQAFPIRGGKSLATEIAQLLIDLQAADDRDVARWMDENEGDGRPPWDVRKRRIRRFTEAFALVAPNKRYIGFETSDGEHRAMFEEDGFRTALADLSTGEKQIVFRGAFLLRNAEHLPGSVTLIDEPELSLHPKWQENIMFYYDKIVSEIPHKSSQIIVATHSPFIMHGSPTAKHIVLRKNLQEHNILSDPRPSFPSANTAEVAVSTFDLSGFVRDASGKHLALIVEGPTDHTIISIAWRKLHPQKEIPFTIRPADGAKNIPRLLGAGGGKSGPLLDALSERNTTLVGLFDFDLEGFAQWKGAITDAELDPDISIDFGYCVRKRKNSRIWASLLPVPSFRQNYANETLAADSRLTIELLLPDSYVESLLERIPVAGDATVTRIAARTSAQKEAVADGVSAMPPDAFQAFQTIFEILARIADIS